MFGLAAACAPVDGWQRAGRGACGAKAPPRVCVLAGPDAPLVVRVGGAELVPGECAAGPKARSGRVTVQTRDGRDGRETTRVIPVRRGQTAMVSPVDGKIVVHERRGCADGG